VFYQPWIRNYILPKWEFTTIDAMAGRPINIEHWMKALKTLDGARPLAPKSKAHIKSLMRFRGEAKTHAAPLRSYRPFSNSRSDVLPFLTMAQAKRRRERTKRFEEQAKAERARDQRQIREAQRKSKQAQREAAAAKRKEAAAHLRAKIIQRTASRRQQRPGPASFCLENADNLARRRLATN
jgi:hypothetical protein